MRKLGWEKIKNIAKLDLTALGAGNIIASATGAVFWLILASIIEVEDYGMISYFIAIGGLVGVIASLGAKNTIIVYTAKGENIQTSISLITIISALVSSIVLWFLFYNLGLSLYVIGFVLFLLVTSELLGRKMYKSYSKFIITQRFLMLGLSLMFVYVIGRDGVILGIGISFLPYGIKLYSHFKNSKIEFTSLKLKKSFMTSSYVMELSRIVSDSADKLIIGPLFGFALLGNYQLGNQFLDVLIILPGIIYHYILPQNAAGASSARLKKYAIATSVFLAALCIILTPMILPQIFPKFKESITIVQIMSLGIIPATIGVFYVSRFLGKEKNKMVVIGSFVDILIKISSIVILGKLFGINGLAIAVVLGMISQAVYFVAMNRFIKD